MLLRAEGVGVAFGGVRALDEVTMSVAAGEVVGLIGPNGAGKTTFIDAVTGFVPATGTIHFGDQQIQGLPAHRRAALGLVRTFQHLELFDDLSLTENVLIGHGRRPGGRHEAAALLDRFGLADHAGSLPPDLSHGQQRLLALARALASRPRLLLLDEPAAGLDSRESAALADPIRAMATGGRAVLLIDHDVDLVFSVCDRVYVLEFGRVIAAGGPAEVSASAAVRAAYLGTTEDGADHDGADHDRAETDSAEAGGVDLDERQSETQEKSP
ncbi:branched-chain amino acid ABC transporter permease [Frankia sp. R43]|uniref:ABC transporter ATP-binding protein n=1 Tax=Frankia sp. R43 TaxID=269536 RepID=UPI0006CA06D1|nr:ATP-binding cassette domain-containing protein [Frankia sp. R43]KPM52120.1 branched-chain amino acid ABC transporter permease [Frankia sp. R43]